MQSKVLLVATLQSHIAQFHKPLMRILKEAGWVVHVAARDDLGEKDGLTLEYPDRVFDLPFERSPYAPENLKVLQQMKALLAANHYDVVHCNTPMGSVIGRLAARHARSEGTKVFYTAHGFHFFKGAPKSAWLLYYPVEKLLSRCTDLLITINKEDEALARSRFRCPVTRIHGVGADETRYFPVDPNEQARLRAALGLSGKVILNVGEMLPNKNQRTAILALKRVLIRHPDARLMLFGNGPDRAALERFARAEGVSEHIAFPGYSTHLAAYVRACDALIACSHREGLPLNVAEAMLCGKPVVASDIRGHRDLIRDGETGFLVPPDDPGACADRLCRILDGECDLSAAAIRAAAPYTRAEAEAAMKRIYGL